MEVAALVLAAGRSSRMGAFKPLLPFGATTVVGHVVGLFRQAGVGCIRVVIGLQADAMTPELAGLGVGGVVNPDFDRGMSGSVRAGVAALPPEVAGCLLLPVDMPLVRPETVRRVVAAAAGGAAVVHPTFQGRRGHPPLIARRLFAAILALPPDEPLSALLERQAEGCDVAVFDRFCLEDMDTPEAYQRMLRALPGRLPPDEAECDAMLAAAGAGEPVRRHGHAVAALAGALAERLRAVGVGVDAELVRAAARVHDIAKGLPDHAVAGAALVIGYGFPALAPAVASHMALPAGADDIDERALVFLADKLVWGEQRIPLEERFAPAMARWRDDPAAMEAVRRRRSAAEAVLRAVAARIELADLVPAGVGESAP